MFSIACGIAILLGLKYCNTWKQYFLCATACYSAYNFMLLPVRLSVTQLGVSQKRPATSDRPAPNISHFVWTTVSSFQWVRLGGGELDQTLCVWVPDTGG